MKLLTDYTSSINLECDDLALEYNIRRLIKFEYLLATNFSTDDTTRRNYSRWINPIYVKDIPYKFADWTTFIGLLSIETETYFVDNNNIGDYLLNIAEMDSLAKLDSYITKDTMDIVIKYFYYRLLLSQNQFIYSSPKTRFVKLYPDETGHIGKAQNGRTIKLKDPFMTAAAKLNSTQIRDIHRECAEETLNYLQYANARVFTEALYKNEADRESIRK
uniref:Peptidase M13 N-terminal domain-containing protein n=1 Tax=Panagrolaimus sp. PS1159 TaxID=55785 RepID=A0AC35F5B4_9BILA